MRRLVSIFGLNFYTLYIENVKYLQGTQQFVFNRDQNITEIETKNWIKRHESGYMVSPGGRSFVNITFVLYKVCGKSYEFVMQHRLVRC